jgi:glycosyltransferase involved in cell wall biosynthesis
MNRIIILVTNDLATDQRVLKVATVFQQNNFEILLVGRRLQNSPDIEFTNRRFKLLFNRSVLFYTEYNIRVFFLLLFAKCSHILANDTDTLPAAFVVSKLKRIRLLFDAHELFPEVPELADRHFVKKIWTKIEDFIFPHLKNSYTVCDSIANYYNQKYGISMKVIRNIPLHHSFSDKILDYGDKKIILYQGALNKGRGIEWVIDAMSMIENAILVIIGTGDLDEQLRTQVRSAKLENKVRFLGRIEASELYKYTPSASLGICLLDNIGLSYYFALPNRIFDYLHAGIPVLATCFPEIENIVSKYKTGELINHYEPEYLAGVINKMLLQHYDKTHFSELSNVLCWEKESAKLIEIIQQTK